MNLQELLIIIGGFLAGWILVEKYRLFSKMAPGPYGLPFVGSIFHLLSHNTIEEFQKYKKKYGKVFSVTVGNFYVTVVTDPRLIIDNLKKDVFSGRPNFPDWAVRNQGNKNRGLLFSDNPVSQEQRRFVLRSIRDFGFGKDSMDGIVVNEMQELRNVLRKELGHPVTLSGVFNPSILNSLWHIITGKRFQLDDPNLQNLVKLLIGHVRDVRITSPTHFLHGPTKLGLIGQKAMQSILNFREHAKPLVDNLINEHFETYEEGQVRDFVDAYIQQIKGSDNNPQSSFHGDEGKLNLYVVLLDFFIAGAETTSATLQYAILYLCHNPRVQRKVQQEIASVIGRSRLPSRSDKSKLVYLEAVLNEVHRLASLVPFNLFHKAMQDGDIGGHLVPKDSIIFFSIYDSHHDPDVWGEDVESFRPERFLDESGTKIVKHEALIPFSIGKRQCLGESLATDNLFVFLSGLLQAFTFELDPDYRGMDLKARPNFISSPKPFKVIITERK